MYYIGIDVSKKALSVYDGKISLEFENQEGLKAFYRYLKKHVQDLDNLGIIFEATGIYSDHLREFCAKHQIKAYILNPKQSHNFAKSLGVRSKTDTIDARVIWRYQSLIPPGEDRSTIHRPRGQDAGILPDQRLVYPGTTGFSIQSLGECHRPYA